MNIDDALALRRVGRLEQTCPSCGVKEAAGPYCTSCTTVTGLEDWHRHQASAASIAALGRLNAQRTAETPRGAPQTAPDERKE